MMPCFKTIAIMYYEFKFYFILVQIQSELITCVRLIEPKAEREDDCKIGSSLNPLQIKLNKYL